MYRNFFCMIFTVLFWSFISVSPALADEDYLEPEKAFQFAAKMRDAHTIEVRYIIADGYYMYRERFAFNAKNAKLGEALIPAGKVKFDATFQKDVETYRKTVTIVLPVEAEGTFVLTVTSQGCADKGLCYAPLDSQIQLSSKGGSLLQAINTVTIAATTAVNTAQKNVEMFSGEVPAKLNTPASPVNAESDIGKIEATLKSGKLLLITPVFLLLGLGLSFTPCVLPMVPILSSIVVGDGARTSRWRAGILSAMYSLGMALVYTGLGIAAGLAGEGLSADLQRPEVLIAFALLMVVFAFSMFGAYQLQLPAVIQTKLAALSGTQTSGKLISTFLMGAISALIIGPCVAAPLAGTLVYISQTKDVVVGGCALFVMALGMSVPLLLVGISAGSLLPRAGMWMDSVKRFFGMLMLALALWIVSPILSVTMQMWGWAALGIGCATYLFFVTRGGLFFKAIALLMAGLGFVQLIGVVTGGQDFISPLGHIVGTAQTKPVFVRVNSNEELTTAIAQAKGKIVMLDFYADWCVSCKEMEKLTFSDPQVKAELANMVLLQADVTGNNVDDKGLLKRFGLFGPPGIIFFNKEGAEVSAGRVIGYQDVTKFLKSITFIKGF